MIKISDVFLILMGISIIYMSAILANTQEFGWWSIVVGIVLSSLATGLIGSIFIKAGFGIMLPEDNLKEGEIFEKIGVVKLPRESVLVVILKTREEKIIVCEMTMEPPKVFKVIKTDYGIACRSLPMEG